MNEGNSGKVAKMEEEKIRKRTCLGELLRIQKDFQEEYYPIEKLDISSLASAIACESMEIGLQVGNGV